MAILKEYFGIGGYTRTPEGAYSWQHLTFVGLLLTAMVVLAVWLGRRNRRRDAAAQNRVLIWSALLIDGLELIKIAIACRSSDAAGDPWYDGILYNLPLFLCSIQLIALPMAAFCRGRLKEAAVDFVAVFGLLGAVLGTVGAAQNYSCYPVLSFDNMVSGFTHTISGFAALYVMVAGLAGLRRRNVGITAGILGTFCVLAYGVNHLIDYNYMFLTAGDGTPYDILYNLVGGSPVWYPIGVVVLFVVYIAAFYGVRGLVAHGIRQKQEAQAENPEISDCILP